MPYLSLSQNAISKTLTIDYINMKYAKKKTLLLAPYVNPLPSTPSTHHEIRHPYRLHELYTECDAQYILRNPRVLRISKHSPRDADGQTEERHDDALDLRTTLQEGDLVWWDAGWKEDYGVNY